MQEADRYARQRSIVPEDKFRACDITVIGIGAIGRQVAMQLAIMGAPRLQLIDDDHVEIVNLGAQGYLETDVGKAKVAATAEACLRFSNSISIHQVQHRFKASDDVANIVFCCVDSITDRAHIWKSCRERTALWVDGRMAAETFRVLTAFDPKTRQHYDTTLFSQDEAFVGACTAKTTIYSANVVAGWMVSRFTQWLRGMHINHDVQVNLIADDIIVRGAAS